MVVLREGTAALLRARIAGMIAAWRGSPQPGETCYLTSCRLCMASAKIARRAKSIDSPVGNSPNAAAKKRL